MKRLLLLLCCIGHLGASAQPTPPATYDPARRYEVAQLQSDFAYLRRALEEVHPGLYWYTPKDSLDRAFARTAAALTHPMAEPEYWQLLQTLVGRMHCGHTRVQHSAAYRAWFRRQPHPYLPFTVAVRHDRLFVAENQSTAPELRPGTELLAIDGHPTAEVLPRLRSLIAADGYGTGFQDKELEVGFFDAYYWSFYEAKPTYPVLVRDSTGQQRTLTPLPRPAKPKPLAPAPTPLTAAQARTRQLDRLRWVRYPEDLPATAILRIREFSYDELEDYKAFHRQLFTELAQRRVKRLVIDLRGNAGGNQEISVDLMKYLCKSGFVLNKSALAPVLFPYFSQPDSTKPNYFHAASVKRLPDGTIGFANPDIGPQQPYRGHYFRGQVVVLVDGGTFSAASNFTASLRAQRRITVVGQETGGAEAGCNGGTISELELPATHLVIQLPHFRILTACPHPQLGRGVRPDLEVVPTPQQVAAHTDAVLSQLPALLR
ncbi:S41 family peptidase [Hymenobacter bucti]|uniref:S41 family peptidase n=1 Tax=Hymenobacter bucti TaxID=1844114 RepID=A0ABW4QTF2_9BACT